MQHSQISKQKGFTLIETLSAVFILMISVMGPITVAQDSLKASFYARDQVVAFYLGQDVLETIKHLRDNYALQGNTGHWLEPLENCKPDPTNETTTRCTMDTSNEFIETASCSGNCKGALYYNSNNKKYSHTPISGVASKYQRIIHITEIVPGTEAQIVVEITWDSGFFTPRKIVLQENIFNWPQAFLNN